MNRHCSPALWSAPRRLLELGPESATVHLQEALPDVRMLAVNAQNLPLGQAIPQPPEQPPGVFSPRLPKRNGLSDYRIR
jgi:hypothetical protein